jgi:phosphinothricin acetyltransferase
MLRIRKAIASDAVGICEIYNQAIEERTATFETEPKTELERRKWLEEHDMMHPVLVAVRSRQVSEIGPGGKDEEIVGWASISIYRTKSWYSMVGEASIYVKQGSRRTGIGKQLMTALIDEAKRLGYSKLVSRIFVINVASRNLFGSCGFREVGIYEKHGKLNGKWVDTVIVERLIHENLS